MEERDEMAQDEGSAPGQPAMATPADGAPVPRWAAWYLALGRRGRLALVTVTVTAAVLVGLTLAGSAGSAAPHPLPLARDFSIPVLGHPGERVSLASYAGKPVIVNFFASWCENCKQETPLLARTYRAASGRIAFIGIDVNDPAGAALAFVHKAGVAYPVGVDAPPMPTAAAYNVAGLPQTFFLNAQHRIVKRVLGAVTRQQLAAGMALIEPTAK